MTPGRVLDLRLGVPVSVAWVGLALGSTRPGLLPVVAAVAVVVCVVAVGLVVVARVGVLAAGQVLLVVALSAGACAGLTGQAAVRDDRRHPSGLTTSVGHAVTVEGRLLDRIEGRADVLTMSVDRLDVGTGTVVLGARVPVRVFGARLDGGGSVEIGAGVSARLVLAPVRYGESVAFEGRAVEPLAVHAGPGRTSAWSNGLRSAFRAVAAGLPGDGGALLPGLAIGDTSGVPDDLDDDMRQASLSHLTAVSGSNCAVLVALVVLVGSLLKVPRLLRLGAAVVVLVAFVVLVTPEPSIVRATVMAVLVLVHLAVARPIAGVPVVALAVAGLLFTDPWLARDLAFVLSVLATSGLVVLGGPLTALLARLVPEPVAAALAVPTAAQLACQPVLLALEPSIAQHGVVANVLAGPAAPVATVGGLVVCVLAPWVPGAATAVAWASWLPSSWVAAVARSAASWPGTRLGWDASALGVASLVGLTALVVVAVVARARGRTRAVAATLLVGVLVATVGVVGGRTVVTRASVPDDWVVAQCDVGQGDAVLVRSGRAVALIDVGDDEAALDRCLSTFGVRHVDLLVLTHFDRDHVGAIDSVVGRVGTALVGPVGRSDDAEVVTALRDGGGEVQEARVGTRGRLGQHTWRLLWPPADIPAGNDASLVLRVDPGAACRVGCLSLLALGDLGETAQRRLASSPDGEEGLGRVDVVKVSHHGSADQHAELYERVAARVGLIGVGADNSYGHPTDVALDLVRHGGGVVVRSDEAGQAAVTTVDRGDGDVALRIWREHAGPRDRDDTSGTSVASSSIGGGAAGPASVGRRPRGSMAARASGKTAKKASVAIDQVGWDRIRPAAVVLVSGPEQFLADRASRQLRDQLAAEDPSLEVHDLEADHYQPGELVTLASPSLFAEPRLIRVSNVEKCTDAFLTETLRYLETPADDTTLVLRHGGGVRGKKLLDAVRGGTGGGLEVVCAELKKDTEKLAFAAAEFAAERRRISQGALRALVTAFNDDLAELASACQQLISDAAAEITEATVEKYYSGRVETNAFKVADAAIAGQQGEALVLLRHALSTGADPVPVVAAFAMKIRTMAKLQGSYGGSGQLASRFGLAPWQVERAQRDLRGWSEDGLGRCIELLAETDAAVKGAERDPVYALERMVTMISTRGALLS